MFFPLSDVQLTEHLQFLEQTHQELEMMDGPSATTQEKELKKMLEELEVRKHPT